jgi:hypothetical protein
VQLSFIESEVLLSASQHCFVGLIEILLRDHVSILTHHSFLPLVLTDACLLGAELLAGWVGGYCLGLVWPSLMHPSWMLRKSSYLFNSCSRLQRFSY